LFFTAFNVSLGFIGIIAAEALATQIKPDHLEKNQLYPAFTEIREISAHIGAAVAAKAYKLGTILFSSNNTTLFLMSCCVCRTPQIPGYSHFTV
jgi:hypothetical protein